MASYLRRGLLFVILLLAPVSQAQPAPEISPLFTVTHTPQPVAATAKVDTVKNTTSYIWLFRTDIHNGFDFPIRVVEFGARDFWQGQWQEPSQAGFTSAQFEAWYTAADSAPGGWIQPGQTAADPSNWNRNSLQICNRSQWYYIAEDADGNRYESRQEVFLAPFVPETTPWSADLPGTLVPLTVRWQPTGEALPAGSQVRVERLANYPYPPHAVYETEKDNPQIKVPGMYRLRVFVPGYQLAEQTVVLPADDTGLELTLHAVANGQTASPDEMLLLPDDAHAYLTEIHRIKLRSDQEYAALISWYEQRSADGTLDDSRYDYGPMEAYLMAHLEPDVPLPIRYYVASLLTAYTTELTAEQARTVAELLPADSVLLAADPGAASISASFIDKVLGTGLRAEMAAHNPDHFVRGRATAGLASQASRDGDLEAVAHYYAALTTEFADMRELDHVRKTLNPANKIQPGHILPDFAAPLLTGEGEITQNTAAGKYRLLHFWASWCGPCKAEMKHVQDTYDQLHPRGLEILSFSLDRKAEDARAYQQVKWHMPWPNAFLADGTNSPTGQAMEIVGIPRLILVDPEGRILAVDGKLRGDGMAEVIAGYLEQ